MKGLARTLVLNGTVDPAAMSLAVEQFGESPELVNHLVQRRLATEIEVAQAIADQTDHTFYDLAGVQLDPAVVALVPGHLCRKYQLIPIEMRPAEAYPMPRRVILAEAEEQSDELVLGMVDPTDIIAIDDVASITDTVIEPVVVTRSALAQAFEHFIRSDEELSEISAALEEDVAADTPIFTENLDGQASDAPVVRFVNLLIAQAVNDRASDIHIEPGEHSLTVRFRIDGVLHEMQRADRAIQDGIISRLKIMSQIDIAERRRPQDGRISINHEGRQVDLRVATVPTVWGEKIVMRILDSSGVKLGIEALGYEPEQQKVLLDAIARPYGMILVTGPTGSGKTVSLYTCLNILNQPGINISTAEDPVEIQLPGVNQVNVNEKAGLTFATALRAFLRQDPDIVMVGEVRDLETADIAIKAAQTGHLVLSTLHTNDAPTTLTRLLNMGVAPFNVASSVILITAQRLARKLCVHCKRPEDIPPEALLRAGFRDEEIDGTWQPYGAVGCDHCKGTGYKGRTGIYEVMTISDEMRLLIMRNGNALEIAELAQREGIRNLRQSGLAKVRSGVLSLEEVEACTNE